MTERIDHVAEAQMLYDAEYGTQPNSLGYETADVQHLLNMLGAQIQATLALVEQQRIANLIALTNRTASFDNELAALGDEAADRLIEWERTPATPFGGPDEHARFRADIREGLGL